LNCADIAGDVFSAFAVLIIEIADSFDSPRYCSTVTAAALVNAWSSTKAAMWLQSRDNPSIVEKAIAH